MWRIEREITIPELNVPVIAFCGIARPQRFFTALRSAGLDVREEVTFRDHHRYSAHDLSALRGEAGGATLVTTEKDLVRIDEPHGIVSVPVEVRILHGEDALDAALGTVL